MMRIDQRSRWSRRAVLCRWTLLGALLVAGQLAGAATWVVDIGGGGDFTSIQGAIDSPSVNPGDILSVQPGIYPETLDIASKSDLSIQGVDETLVTLQPTTVLGWNVGGYGSTRTATVRVVDSTDIDFSGITFDFDIVKAAWVYGILYWDSTGDLDDCTLDNMGIVGTETEYGAYFRAPGFSSTTMAQISVTNCVLRDLGRAALQTSDFVHGVISGNTIMRTFVDYGYGVVVSSESTAEITGNDISYFSNAGVGWAGSGIRIHNAFTDEITTALPKPVSVVGNTLYENHFAVSVGAQPPNTPGNVDILVTLQGNVIYDNEDVGVQLTDNNASAGSSVTMLASENSFQDNNHYGYYVSHEGDGNITLLAETEEVLGHDWGIGLLDPDLSYTGFYLDVHHCRIFGNTIGAECAVTLPMQFFAEDNWWGCNEGPNDVAGDCDPVVHYPAALIDFDPWLTMQIAAAPDVIWPGLTSDVATNLRWNSDGLDTSGQGYIPDGTEIVFSTNLGDLAPPPNRPTTDAEATTVLSDGGDMGIATVQAALDGEVVTTQVEILASPVIPTLSGFGLALLLVGMGAALVRRRR